MTTQAYDPAAAAAVPRQATHALTALIRRLHFYIGLFVAPFILVAAVTGTLFVLTPQIEAALYAGQLRNASHGPAQPLGAQVQAAQAWLAARGEASPRLFAVRPSKGESFNTRVMFSQKGLGEGESRAIFVDPVSLAVMGDLAVYGTNGTLPLRTTLDFLHRDLMLGALGRNYSELAASWLWFAALGGVWLWWQARPKSQSAPKRRPLTVRRLHSLLGLCIVLGLVFFSATGMTWSRWAGGHVDMLRAAIGWVTPSASMQLQPSATPAAADPHAEHHAMMMMDMPAAGDPARVDMVEGIARAGGINAREIEIRPPRGPNQAWMVREVDRAWPTQVDTVAVDPDRMAITSRADFATFPLIAKLIRWSVDAHMGILFGVANQIIMAVFGIGLSAMIVLGYLMWWRRRPSAATMAPLMQTVLQLSPAQRLATALVALALGYAMPLMGISLAGFLLVDVLRWRLARR